MSIIDLWLARRFVKLAQSPN